MTPQGFIRCDECKGRGWKTGLPKSLYEKPCPTCSGSGLLPTDELTNEAYRVLMDGVLVSPSDAALAAGAVLRKVAEHLGGREVKDTHHHHLPDDTTVFHSHVEVEGNHPLAVSWWIEERHMREAGFAEECRERGCAMRRHDDN